VQMRNNIRTIKYWNEVSVKYKATNTRCRAPCHLINFNHRAYIQNSILLFFSLLATMRMNITYIQYAIS
jgi:hypothetical protein